MNKITPFLWFDNNLEEAMEFYQTVFKNFSVNNVLRYSKAGPGPEGAVMTASFTLNSQEFTGMNGGPQYKFNEAVSFVVDCQTQEEVDYYWEKLTAGGQEVACGWLKDKFGLAWQVTPSVLIKYLGDNDKEKAGRVMQAMMQMVKLDIKGIEDAYNG
ncbi:VOC family protein [Mucilaginibacter sp. 14171R-50]|uniref:VOC family protein n=1 Tax=Mucilaginibacter sp. 14171R-50 TaxID=2703789 RepID=UPI00138D9747|nr:VOC family protein [Mucilaginibacter sp. 14171R-50]QHS56931.1 VOC family protein [Mucilaginibacter sp. 14171R-50]